MCLGTLAKENKEVYIYIYIYIYGDFNPELLKIDDTDHFFPICF